MTQSTDRGLPTGSRPISLRTLAEMARRDEPFACLTAYDFTTAKLLERAGVHVLLVGDSAANVILGHDSTIHMPLDLAVVLTAAVKRGAPSTVVMADMPFMSYQTSDADAVASAGRFMTEGLADIVKVEADESFAGTVHKMTRSGIPVCAHVGTRPQTAALTGGPRASGRTADAAKQIVADAVALEQAGASVLLIEAVPAEVTAAVLAATTSPLIGIGAGTACHGQILVVHDLLGLSDQPPRFAEPAADLAAHTVQAAQTWVKRVADRNPGGRGYTMAPGESLPQNQTNTTAGSTSQPARNGI